MNLQQLITFSAVISEGSMTAAAEKLYLTQPAVSQQIRNLEDELGVNLLDRGVRQARPTVQGQLLFDYARRIIALTQQAQIAIQTMGEGIKGTLRIGTLNSLGLQIISPAVGAFLKHNSKISIQLIYSESMEALSALRRGDLDVAILPDIVNEYGEPEDGLEKRQLVKDEMWLAASSRDVGAPSSISVDELVNRPYIRLTEKYGGFERALGAQLEKRGVKLIPAFESNNVGTLKRVIESGLGWGFLPAHSIRKQVRTGRMVEIDVKDVAHQFHVNYYFKTVDLDKPPVEVFYKALKQQTPNA
jgi:DNA-binding transcriptional LysR family regulator